MLKKIINKIKYELQFNNTQYYTRISEKVLKTRYRQKLQKKIESLEPIVLDGANCRLTLAILANKKNFYESLATLYSFCYWEKNLVIHYHEDGTLDDGDIAAMKKIFPGIKVFRKADQNLSVNKYLTNKGLTHCAKLREHFIFAVRLFDMLIEKRTTYLLQVDSDVLFFSKPTEVLNLINEGKLNGCYNMDVGNMYSFHPDVLAKYLTTPVLDKVNAGLFLHNFDDELFDFVEQVLKNQPEAFSSWHLEQTFFAMYATVKGNFLALPKQYDLQRRERNAGNPIISEHYCHNTGYDFHKDFLYKISPQYS